LGDALWWRFGPVSVVLTITDITAAALAGPTESRTASMLSLGSGRQGVVWGSRPAPDDLGLQPLLRARLMTTPATSGM
jgi:hypothetical protein